MKNDKLIIIILFLVFANATLFAQKKNNFKDLYIEPSISYGRLIGTEEEDFSNLVAHSTYNFAISFGRQSTGSQNWEKYLGCPDYGVTFKYGTSNYELFPQRFALLGYVNGRIFQREKFGLTYKLGGGLSYWTSIYDAETNPDNIYIGTALNCHIHLELGTYFRVSKNSDITFAALISHSSNGAVKLPNRGANGVALQAGYRYHINGRKEINKEFDIKPEFFPKNSFYINIGPGFLESRKGGGLNTYFACTTQIGFARMCRPSFRYGAGIDLMYSAEIPMMLPEGEREQWKGFNSAVYANVDILYNRFVVHIAFATYIYRYDYRSDYEGKPFFLPYYERVGVKYQLGKNRNHSLGICMKVHLGSIDHIEWTYGFQFLNWNDKKAKR
ncbi:acyloxyacyl hydrolase [Bacteroidales bacterium OttesenSCG-928-K03]|nr:acyloxyacyl hydrolase [Bacteroidales bacterium OttesenSCG-928-L14]MDL2240237.1 acyloxyacyl hydrolase [Bacteroidales bacterium OttesenSCG-928-K22]MDL2242427.1 acyloxyacyl hydrolase [Bacteroidales bacterium OttesenSCG-928-K03]